MPRRLTAEATDDRPERLPAPETVRIGLRDAIMAGDILPGTQLRQDEIAARFVLQALRHRIREVDDHRVGARCGRLGEAFRPTRRHEQRGGDRRHHGCAFASMWTLPSLSVQ